MDYQISIFDILADEQESFICDRCLYNEKGCCSYNEPLGRTCIEGDAYEDIFDTGINALVEIYEYNIDRLITIIERETGIQLTYNGFYDCYRYKLKDREINIDLARYCMTDCTNWHIGVAFEFKTNDHYGGARPCDTLAEVINRINWILAYKTKEKDTKI